MILRPLSITSMDDIVRKFTPVLASFLTSELIHNQYGLLTKVMQHPSLKEMKPVATTGPLDMYLLLSFGDGRYEIKILVVLAKISADKHLRKFKNFHNMPKN